MASIDAVAVMESQGRGIETAVVEVKTRHDRHFLEAENLGLTLDGAERYAYI